MAPPGGWLDAAFLLDLAIVSVAFSLAIPPWGPQDARPPSPWWTALVALAAGGVVVALNDAFGLLAGRGGFMLRLTVVIALAFPFVRAIRDRRQQRM